jgi:hypothetical protein
VALAVDNQVPVLAAVNNAIQNVSQLLALEQPGPFAPLLREGHIGLKVV